MACFKSGATSDDNTVKSKHIDKKIKKERREFDLTHRIPVVGAGESGKSTLIKQMQILYIQGGFKEEDRRKIVADIRRNVSDAMLSITSAMQRIQPPVSLELAENQARVDYIQQQCVRPDFQYCEEFFQHCKCLWADRGVQECYSRSNEYQLIDSAKYFLDKVEEVASDDFRPSNQDILRCRVLTSGIYETKFDMGKVHFHMFDVGGQRDERRKWIQVFCDITAVIFVSACSGYDMTLRELQTQNRLRESISLFKDVWCNRFLTKTSVILFLNKQDLFAEKIKKGKSKLATYFPSFANYHVANGLLSSSGEDAEVERAKYFIRDQFLQIAELNNDGNRRCYPHYTTAVDTENVKRVFTDCQDMLQRIYMQKMNLL